MATEVPSSRDARRRRRRPVHVARTRSAQPPGTSRPMTAASTVPGASTGAPPHGVGRTGPPGSARAAGPRRRATRRAPVAARRTTSAIGTVGCAAGTARQSRAGTPCTASRLLGADRPPRTPSRVAVWAFRHGVGGATGQREKGGTRVAGDVGENCKFPICGNRKPHTLVVGGGCPAFHDVDDVNSYRVRQHQHWLRSASEERREDVAP